MKAPTLLRIASVVAVIQFAAHALLFVLGKPRHGPEEIAIVDAMRIHSFNFGGFNRSYWDMYFGYGLLAAINCLVQAVLFWQLATIARTQAALVRPIAILFIIANGVHALMCLRFFFLTPVIPDVAIIACLSLVCFASPQPEPSASVA